jgi:hypothetical protein
MVSHRHTREPLKKRVRYPHRRGARPIIFHWTESYGIPVTNFMQNWINALTEPRETEEVDLALTA